jgi:NAD(P)-dependent dehydrogenase (short-subunit alcohol dehydrogenase family)
MGVLDGKVAIVTGAGRGIGRAIAMDMAAEGASVVVNDLGGTTDGGGASRVADEVVEEIRVSTVEGGRAIFERAIEAFDGLDILVNNAGILRDKSLFNMEEEDWDQVIAVHLKGHYCCTRPFVRYIRETQRPGCRIINFSSVSGLYGNFGQSNYGAAKAGIAGFTRVVALEVAKYGATCNVISPGAATRMTIPLMEARGVVLWLASPAAQEFNGQIIHVAGGLLGIMQQPAVIRAFESDKRWTLQDLDRAMPTLLDAKKAHDARVKKEGEPQPW